MQVNNLISYIFFFSLFLAKVSQSLKVINDVFIAVPINTPLDEFLTNVWIIRPSLRLRSLIDMLRSVSQQILIADVIPCKSVIGLKTMYVVEKKEATLNTASPGEGHILSIGIRCVLVL